MNEPTHRQHLILQEVEVLGQECRRTGNEDNIELYWELVRNGYLQNFALLGGEYQWRFTLKDKAREYLKAVDGMKG